MNGRERSFGRGKSSSLTWRGESLADPNLSPSEVSEPLGKELFGAPFSKHNRSMAISTFESAAVGSEVVP